MKKLVSLILALVMALSCFVLSASAEDVNLTMWTFLNLSSTNARAIVLGKLIENFEASHPGVTVTVETQEWTTLSSKVIAATAAGNAPDLFMVNSENLGATLQAGCFEPLENLAVCAGWTDAEYADVESAMWNAGFDGTYHYQVPCFYTTYGIHYRKDLFRENGIDVNDIKTWDDLVEVAKKLTYVDANGNQIYGLGNGYSTAATDPQGYLPSVLASQEGGLFNADGTPNNWTGEYAVKALQWEYDLIDSGIDSTAACSISLEELYNLYEAGNYAMCFGGSVRVPTVKSLVAFNPDDTGYMGNPALTADGEKTLSPVAGWHVGVSTTSAHKDLAGEFLAYYMSPEADAMWVTEANQLPLRASTLAAYPEVFEENDWMAVAFDIVADHSFAYSTEYAVAGFSEDLQNAIINAYVNGYSCEDAMAEAEQSFLNRNVGR